jgi:thiol-disulfide isomerase/thioredoxin
MSRAVFAGIAALAVGGGAMLWWNVHPSPEPATPPIAPAALWSASFTDIDGQAHTLGELQGKILVVNFWATWCVPCREEMPGFSRLHERWKSRGVRFIGLADDDPAKVARFANDLSISYPLWTGGDTVGELGRRLGNRLGVLPYTVIIDPAGRSLDTKVGPYTEDELARKLEVFAPKIAK